jgi:hypothetical protein
MRLQSCCQTVAARFTPGRAGDAAMQQEVFPISAIAPFSSTLEFPVAEVAITRRRLPDPMQAAAGRRSGYVTRGTRVTCARNQISGHVSQQAYAKLNSRHPHHVQAAASLHVVSISGNPT